MGIAGARAVLSFSRMFRSPMRLDARNRTMTLVVTGIGVVTAAVVTLSGARAGTAVMGLLGIVLLLSWAMSPSGVTVRDGELHVDRRAWSPLRIPLSSIASAVPVAGLGAGTLRLFGVGGFFGSYGLFSNRELGRFRLYATRGGQAVLVKRAGDALPLVLTPDDVAGTIAAIDGRPQVVF
jgi:hypothetical protein